MAVRETTEPAAAGRQDVSVLLEAFRQFEANAQRLESAYRKMQEDFKKVNIELDAKNNLLSQILQNLTNSVVAVDTQGRITSYNRGAEKLTGFPVDEAVGRPYAEILGRDVDPERSLMHTLGTGQHITEQEKNILHADGYAVPVSFSTGLLEDGHGQLLGALEVLRDLSEVRKMQEEVQRSKTLAALGEMSAAVAHEIRNPLGAIGGYVTLLEDELRDDPARLDLVKRLLNSVSSLNKIVSNLLLYTRPLALHLQEVTLQDHVGQVLDFIAIGITREGVEMRRDFPAAPVRVRIDPEKMEQVIINLVQNAVQALPEAGSVTVKIADRRAAPKERIFLNGLRVERVVILEIRDTGRGIREEDAEKIFNPFFTTRTDGNGLGLSIVKKIVELHNGEITVKSRMGEGTVFTLCFPG